MSVSLYDKALHKKISSWLEGPDGKTKVRVLKPDESLRMIQLKSADNKDKPLSLPFISIAREPDINLVYKGKKPMSFDGMRIGGLQEEGKQKSLNLNAIPIILNYQIDIWTKTYEESDEYIRNLLFNLINHPSMLVEIPYNGINKVHQCNIDVNSPIQDNSDIPQRMYVGEFTRWTINITIQDAYLFSVPKETDVEIVDTEVEAEFADPHISK